MTAAAGAALAAVLLTGCAGHPASPRGSVTSCTQFGLNAIRHHVTVTALPDACQGLSQAGVNQAVSGALRAAAAGVHGKHPYLALIARDTPYLAHLVRGVPAAGKPGAAPVSGPPSHTALSLAALVAWLITIGLGTAMMARWITRVLRTGARQDRGQWPVRNFAHFGLAVVSLLTWIGYVATGITGLAWAACVLLLPVVGLGMTLVFLAPARGQGTSRSSITFVIAAHISAALITILLAVLALAGSG